MQGQVEQQTEQDSSNYQQKTLEAIRLVQAGADERTALQITNNKPVISERAIANLKEKCKKYDLARPRIQKLVDSQVVRILKGEGREFLQRKCTKDGQVIEYTEVIPVADSAITAVMGMSLDRSQPAKTFNTNLNLSVECSPVDLDRWQNRDRQASIPVHNSQSGAIIDCYKTPECDHDK